MTENVSAKLLTVPSDLTVMGEDYQIAYQTNCILSKMPS